VRIRIWVLAFFAAAPAVAGDVSVSISVGQPGFYGQLNIGGFPPPQVIYTQPVVVAHAPEFVDEPPIYLHVPPGHEKHWSKHCAEYNACGRRVLFVRDDWYQNEYAPRYRRGDYDHERHDQERHDRDEHHDRDHGHGHDEGHDHGHDHND
jgi:hypothetical protein